MTTIVVMDHGCMNLASIGGQELALLRYLSGRKRGSVGEVAAEFGRDNGVGRTTILNMMERLRAKGYLKRSKAEGVYQYRVTTSPADAARGAIGRFVESTLGGSVTPLVAWMAERGEVSDAELAELKKLVAQLQSGRKRT